VRGDPPAVITERGPIAESNQREELIELAVAVYGEHALAELIKGDLLAGDNRCEDDAHARSCLCSPSRRPALQFGERVNT
jgi:hypothetical protein